MFFREGTQNDIILYVQNNIQYRQHVCSIEKKKIELLID